MSLRIEDGVPIPPKNIRTGKVVAIKALMPSQSVFFKGARSDTVQSLIYQLRRKGLAGTFTVRTVDGGARVWRTE
jgi:hypothetical protein